MRPDGRNIEQGRERLPAKVRVKLLRRSPRIAPKPTRSGGAGGIDAGFEQSAPATKPANLRDRRHPAQLASFASKRRVGNVREIHRSDTGKNSLVKNAEVEGRWILISAEDCGFARESRTENRP